MKAAKRAVRRWWRRRWATFKKACRVLAKRLWQKILRALNHPGAGFNGSPASARPGGAESFQKFKAEYPEIGARIDARSER